MNADIKSQLMARLGQVGCFLVDAVVMGAAYLIAFLLRFDFQAPMWGWEGVAYSFITVFLVQDAALAVVEETTS